MYFAPSNDLALAFDLLYLHLRSDAIAEISNWIKGMRSDPAFLNLDYKVVSFIETDDAGEWGWKNHEWKAFETEFCFRTAKTTCRPKRSARLE